MTPFKQFKIVSFYIINKFIHTHTYFKGQKTRTERQRGEVEGEGRDDNACT